MKKISSILFVLVLFCSFSFVFVKIAAATQTIRIGYFNVPPFIIYDSEKKILAGGALYEFLEHYMGPAMGVEFAWDKAPTTIPRQINSLSTGSIDAAALLTYSPQRAQEMVLTEKPFYISFSALAVLKENKLNKIETIEDILPLRIGYGQRAYLTEFMQDKRLCFDLIGTGNFVEQNIKKLVSKRIDAVYTPDAASLIAAVKKVETDDAVKVLRLPDKPSAFHVVFADHMEDTAARYNKVFLQIDGTQTFLTILGRYIDMSILK